MRIKMHLLGTGTAVLLSVYAVTAYAGQEIREQRRLMEDLLMPEILYEEADGNQGYYKAAPEVRIIHKQTDAVTKYEFLSADNSKKMGSLELMEGQDQESVYLGKEDFKDGRNVLRVWMEKDFTGPDENGEEGNGAGGSSTEGSGTGENELEGSDAGESSSGDGSGGNEAQENGSGESNSEDSRTDMDGTEGAGLAENGSVEKAEKDAEDDFSKDDTPKKDFLPPAEPETVFEKEIHFLIDTKKPSKVHFLYNRAIRDDSILTNEPIELTLKSTDVGSGMEAIYYRTGDGAAGTLTGDSGSLILNPGFHGRVEAYAVDKAGNRSESGMSAVLLCESQPPDIRIEAEGKIDAWRSDPLRVNVKVFDPDLSSGIQCLKCYVGGEVTVHRENGYQTGIISMEDGFTVDISSEGGKGIPVVVEVLDWAGNFQSESRLAYIDKNAPAIQSDEIHDHMIAGQPVKGKMRIQEENDLASASMEVWKVTSDKKRELMEEKKKEPEPFSGPQEIEWDIMLEEDGVYDIHMTAKDRAGHESRQDSQVIVDQTNPVIRYVDQMQGVYVPYFQWNYGKEEVVQDATDYSYDIFLDGAFYTAEIGRAHV